ncbi:hypothetical protein EVB87_186 [Rhizobium phage RHph_N28_1]|nr:hypothetical protein EVB87_186 [Rhizobium phage RHph_N28_1]QIG74215.1 hypothetical protein EVC07_187 [Rhizobium phage RHph_N42]QIG74822.1 hypothetical protein EVC12_187 [Rhizobium phage RHph_I42]QXV73874.1 hypothetical protein [Rhizobium phage RHph_N46]
MAATVTKLALELNAERIRIRVRRPIPSISPVPTPVVDNGIIELPEFEFTGSEDELRASAERAALLAGVVEVIYSLRGSAFVGAYASLMWKYDDGSIHHVLTQGRLP